MKEIYLFTHSFPFGKAQEVFLETEMKIVSGLDLKLTVIPLKKHNNLKKLPDNITLDSKLSEISFCSKAKLFASMLYNKFFWTIPFQERNSPSTWKDYFYAVKYLFGALMIKNYLIENKSRFNPNSIIYSYWFNHTSLGVVMAKLKDRHYKDVSVITRAHGFDLYEKEVGMYFPYRELTLENIDFVFSVSERGKSFLIDKYPFHKHKILVSRLGVTPVSNNIEKIFDKTVNILSCSSVSSVKRVNLIYTSLLYFSRQNETLNLKWTHIGEGPDFQGLKRLISSNANPENLIIDLKGFIDNSEVKKILGRSRFDVFINTSHSEGIPVSVMEAMSAGIPVLATDVGGTAEIVTHETGLLLDVNFTPGDFEIALKKLLQSYHSYNNNVKKFYLNNYNAELNYSKFYSYLESGFTN